MKYRFLFFLGLVFLLAAALPMSAGPIYYELLLNNDGAIHDVYIPDPLTVPAGYQSTLDPVSGLGSLRAVISGAGDHFFVFYIDLELGNEYGSPSNDETGTGSITNSPGMPLISGQIDDAFSGTIWPNANSNSLDNLNHATTPMDVAMALAWSFTLDAGHKADIRFHIDTQLPVGIATNYLRQIQPPDPNMQPNPMPELNVYLWTTLDVVPLGDVPEIPEPGTLLLMGGGLAALLMGVSRRRAG